MGQLLHSTKLALYC